MALLELFVHGCQELHNDHHHHDLLHHIAHQNEQILEKLEKLMSTTPTVTDLDNSIGTVETAVTKLGTDLLKAISDLEAKVSAAPPQTFDPTPEIARMKAIATNLANLDTDATAADPGAPAPTPVSSTTQLALVEGQTLVAGSPINLTGSVTGSTSPNPTGTVAITDSTNAVNLSATLDANGGFTASISSLAAGSYSLNASYAGDSLNQPSNATLSISVSAAATA